MKQAENKTDRKAGQRKPEKAIQTGAWLIEKLIATLKLQLELQGIGAMELQL